MVLRTPICHVFDVKITWVPNYRCPIWTFCNWIPVIGYPRDFHVNYTRFKGFHRNVWFSFQNLPKPLLTFSPERNSQKTFLILKFVTDTISNSDWTSCHTIQGVIVLIISNRPRASRSSDFEITRVITPWIVLHSVQLLLLIAVTLGSKHFQSTRLMLAWTVKYSNNILLHII